MLMVTCEDRCGVVQSTHYTSEHMGHIKHVQGRSDFCQPKTNLCEHNSVAQGNDRYKLYCVSLAVRDCRSSEYSQVYPSHWFQGKINNTGEAFLMFVQHPPITPSYYIGHRYYRFRTVLKRENKYESSFRIWMLKLKRWLLKKYQLISLLWQVEFEMQAVENFLFAVHEKGGSSNLMMCYWVMTAGKMVQEVLLLILPLEARLAAYTPTDTAQDDWALGKRTSHEIKKIFYKISRYLKIFISRL